jgi:endonuclease/exonuclease/phosphatase family metal-dependent hydrolase
MKLKILLFNAGYFRGIDGSIRQYITRAHRHVISSKSLQKELLDEFASLMEKESPDISCLVEVDTGSFTNRYLNQLRHIAKGEYAFFDAAEKYDPKKGKARGVFVGKSGGFISKKELPFSRKYLSVGTKRLVYEIRFGGTAIFLAHLDLLSSKVRREQLRELASWVVKEKNVIVCGDFNIMKGIGELDEFLKATGLVLMNKKEDAAYPSHKPFRLLDLFMCSPDIASTAHIRVLKGVMISDHLPVILEATGDSL